MNIEAMKQALEALETCMYPQQKQMQAITALRQAIAEAEKQAQEQKNFDLMNESFEREEANQARVREFMRNH